VPPPPVQLTNIISVTNAWRHLTGANLDGQNWQAPGYDDSSWPQGQPLIGNGNPQGEPIRTPYPNTPGPHHLLFSIHVYIPQQPDS
jgi:hypothetical protein